MLPSTTTEKEQILSDLGYPNNSQSTPHNQISIPTNLEISKIVPKRVRAGSKYDHGTVTVLAGSKGMCGAATLVSQAVLKSGAGMCYLITPNSISDILSVKLTEPVILPSPEINGSLSRDCVEIINSLNKKTDALILGPGLSQNEETAEMVRQVCQSSMLPLVLDGDGLNAFVNKIELFKKCKNIAITPHYGEWVRLFGELSTNPVERADAVREVAVAYGITTIFKGFPTIIATPDDGVTVLPVGNSGMATAGSGDVLAGVLGSLLAQGLNLKDAAVAAVALHGKAGDLAAKIVGEHSLVATDILESIGKSFLSFKGLSNNGLSKE